MTSQRVVLITGASSGIGYAAALAFAKQGEHVVGTARRAERLQQLETEIKAIPGSHGEFLPVTADVRDATSMQRAVEQTSERFGRLDILVANAGVGHRGSVVQAEWDDIETLLRTNIDGVLHSIRAAVPLMQQNQQGGHIIIVSSVSYNMVAPYAALYAASKAFVSSLSHSLRLELESDNIRVTDLLIGRTETEFSQNRLGKPGRSAGGIPVMPVDQVVQAIVRASTTNRKSIALRWFDRLFMIGNMIVPDFIGRRAIRQYK